MNIEELKKDSTFIQSPAYNITYDDIYNWNNKSNFSGYYNDLKETYKTLHLNEFIYRHNDQNNSYDLISNEEKQFMENCGFVNGYIENINNLFNKDDGTGISLIEEIKEINDAFFTNKLCYLYLPFNKTHLLITQLRNLYSKDTLEKKFSILCCTPYYDTNFFYQVPKFQMINTKDELDQFTTTLRNRCISISLIFEYSKNILFSHFEYLNNSEKD